MFLIPTAVVLRYSISGSNVQNQISIKEPWSSGWIAGLRNQEWPVHLLVRCGCWQYHTISDCYCIHRFHPLPWFESLLNHCFVFFLIFTCYLLPTNTSTRSAVSTVVNPPLGHVSPPAWSMESPRKQQTSPVFCPFSDRTIYYIHLYTSNIHLYTSIYQIVSDC